MEKAIIGRKIGMSQIFDEAGKVIPVTVIEAGPCVVVQKKTEEKDGYNAVQLGFQDVEEKKLTKPEQGHLKKAEVPMKKVLKEFKLDKAAEKGRIGRPVRVMVVGAPNTGKSTIINALAGRKAAVTGDKPGVTKDFKWIMTGGRLELMDMAGVLWPRIANAKSGICLTALGSVKEEVTDVVKVAYETLKIMYDIYPDLLKERYGVDMEIQAEEDEGYFQDPFYDIFLAMAKKRGCILSGGRIDEERFARLFLNDLREGRTGRITLEMPEDFK